jgi:hypothetical protein
MRMLQSLRWVLTETEVARLCHDPVGGTAPWYGSEPWFIRSGRPSLHWRRAS